MSSLFGFQSKEEKLCEAAKKGDTNTVKSLLKENTHIDVNYRDNNNYGYTALHRAAENGHREICELLISNSNTSWFHGRLTKKFRWLFPQKYEAR